MKRKASQVEIVDSVESELYSTVRAIITRARAAVYVAANTAMVEAYWNVGREIVAKQGGKAKAKYGEGLVKGLAVKLTAEFGDGFTEANLRYMRLVYLAFPNRHTLCDKLSWSHYRTLVKVENPDARQYYMDLAWRRHIIRDTRMSNNLYKGVCPFETYFETWKII